MATRAAAAIAIDTEINDGMAEIELQKLQRQYRIMEGDRKAYSEESRLLIGKQRKSIDKLKAENEHLQSELKLLEQHNEARKKIGIQSKKAEQMANVADGLQRKIRIVLEDIQALNHDNAKVADEISRQRALLGGINSDQMNNSAIDKQVRVLENRLEKALVKFNKALAVNKQLRGVIDNLRRERLVFDNIYHKFEKELTEQKKQMADIIEASNAAYENRDEAQSKIIVLREKAEKEFQVYIQETKEIDRILEQDRRLKEFMATKNSHRTISVNPKIKKSQKEGTGVNKTPSEEISSVPLDTYEKAFAEIREVTGISDINELVKRFKEVEDQNFSHFNYVNEINNEVELLAEEIVTLQSKLNQMKVEAVAIEEEHKQQLQSLELALNSTKDKSEQFEKQNQDIGIVLSDLKNNVETVIAKLHEISQKRESSLDVSALKDTKEDTPEEGQERPATGGSLMSKSKRAEKLRALIDFSLPSDAISPTGVSEGNLINYLGMIENKANELLTLNYLVTSPKKPIQLTGDTERLGVMPLGGVAGLLGHGPTAPVGALSIIPPSTADDYDSGDNASDEDERPLTREELKQKTLRGLSKRERTANVQKVSNSHKAKRKNNRKEN